jgi:RimJ/RimL family protein N-acetyltransferase
MSIVRASVPTSAGIAQLRDLEERDIEPITRYWFDSGDAHLDFLGVDKRLLGKREDAIERFRRTIPSGDPNQMRLAFSITLDDAFIGYTLLNRFDARTNYSHWHITDERRRAGGISSALYPWRIKIYFDAAPIERLIHRTRTNNLGVNRLLDRFVPVAETVYVEHSDGVALPGEFHLRFVNRADVPGLLEMAHAASTRKDEIDVQDSSRPR